jgi:hypothetical protein
VLAWMATHLALHTSISSLQFLVHNESHRLHWCDVKLNCCIVLSSSHLVFIIFLRCLAYIDDGRAVGGFSDRYSTHSVHPCHGRQGYSTWPFDPAPPFLCRNGSSGCTPVYLSLRYRPSSRIPSSHAYSTCSLRKIQKSLLKGPGVVTFPRPT